MVTAERIKQARKERGWTQQEMAEALGISTSHLSGIEQGARPAGNAFSIVFENLFPSRQPRSRKEALKTLNTVLKTKDTDTIWALVDFLRKV